MTTDEQLDRLEALQDSLERIVGSIGLAVGDLRQVIAPDAGHADEQRRRDSERINALLLAAERRAH
jgi:hypothetical protein